MRTYDDDETVPLAGVAESHAPPDVVAATAVKAIPAVPEMLTD